MLKSMISKFTAFVAFVGLMLFSAPAVAQDHGHDATTHDEAHHEEMHHEEAAHDAVAHEEDHHAEEGAHAEEAHAGHDEHGEEGEKDVKTVIKETIEHHLADSYEFHITEGVGFPLPVILFDEGVKVFMSSKFHHGHDVVEAGGKHYMMSHGKIYSADAAGNLLLDEEGHHIKPLDFSITKNVFMILAMSIFMFFLFSGVAKTYKTSLVPRKSGRFLEPLVVFVRDEIAIPNIGEKHYKKYMSFLLTTFFFIWFLNLAGMTPLGVNVTGNIAITLSLALITFLITQFTGKKDYWMHVFWMPGVPVLIRPVLAVIELIGLVVKPFSLMIRLYANMLAGHVVIMSILGLIFVFGSWVASVPFLGLTLFLSVLELLVAALQAYIFTMLASLYFGAAVEEHDHH